MSGAFAIPHVCEIIMSHNSLIHSIYKGTTSIGKRGGVSHATHHCIWDSVHLYYNLNDMGCSVV